ncbi:hypothetical protein C8J57DRAFT_1287742 [Mycena rebaudengoi]|nr:hypothetical protein C8J57DRAFT_1287742 [Mycena rebaudengoi]
MHHNPSRMVRERRQPSSSAIVDAGSEQTHSPVNIPAVPTSTTALAVIVCILGVIILGGVGICMFRRYKRKNQTNSAPSQIIDFTSEKTRRYEVDSKVDLHASAYLEKPSPAFIPGAQAVEMNTGWVPQIRTYGGAELESQSSMSSKKSKKSGKKSSLRSSRGWEKTFSKLAPSERSPPPSYLHAGGSADRVPSFASQVPLPPSPPQHSFILLPQLPLPSPARSASFASHQAASLGEMERNADDDETALPRLMAVVVPYTPTLDDELGIKIGETVLILEEYQDGWALVQRVGRIDAPRGVVPRTCIAERERIVNVNSPGRRL